MQLSQALAATQSALLASQFTGGFIRLFSGAPPSSPDQAETGTLLGIVSVDGLGGGLHFTSVGAVMSMADERWRFHALATGTTGWFRLVRPGDTGANDLTALRLDGIVGIPAAPGDMQWDSLAVTLGLVYSIDSFLYLIQPIGDAP
ncbi:MAG: hypothetical protein V4641_05585 [Pseudomonadota bacterium]